MIEDLRIEEKLYSFNLPEGAAFIAGMLVMNEAAARKLGGTLLRALQPSRKGKYQIPLNKRCPCGAMSKTRAKQRNHKCGASQA